jgi:hypothetical protein
VENDRKLLLAFSEHQSFELRHSFGELLGRLLEVGPHVSVKALPMRRGFRGSERRG